MKKMETGRKQNRKKKRRESNGLIYLFIIADQLFECYLNPKHILYRKNNSFFILRVNIALTISFF